MSDIQTTEEIKTNITGGITQNPETSVSNNTNTQNTNIQNNTTTTAKTFTLTQVATHSSESDCYSAINGNVYNLTTWITQHPGGDRAILSICGKDGSGAFNDRHGGQGGPESILAGFEVGILK